VLELALREAIALGEKYVGTEHILLGLVRENGGVAARVLLDLDVDAEMIRSELTRFRSGLGDPRPGALPQLVIACPGCAHPLETIPADARNTRFEASLEGDRTCSACGRGGRSPTPSRGANAPTERIRAVCGETEFASRRMSANCGNSLVASGFPTP